MKIYAGRDSMAKYICKRLFAGVLTIIVLITVAFFPWISRATKVVPMPSNSGNCWAWS